MIRNARMEAGIQKLLVEYLRKTKRIKTLEVLCDELIPEKRTKLSFSIQSTPKRPQPEVVIKKSSSKSKKSAASDEKRMIYSLNIFKIRILSYLTERIQNHCKESRLAEGTLGLLLRISKRFQVRD